MALTSKPYPTQGDRMPAAVHAAIDALSAAPTANALRVPGTDAMKVSRLLADLPMARGLSGLIDLRKALIKHMRERLASTEVVKQDERVLRDMLSVAEATDRSDEESLTRMLRELVRKQFALTAEERHDLAGAVPPVADAINVQFGVAQDDTFITFANAYVEAAYFKVYACCGDPAYQEYADALLLAVPTRGRSAPSDAQRARKVRANYLRTTKECNRALEALSDATGSLDAAALAPSLAAQRQATEALQRKQSAAAAAERLMKDLNIDVKSKEWSQRSSESHRRSLVALRNLPAPLALRVPSLIRVDFDSCMAILDDRFQLPYQVQESIQAMRSTLGHSRELDDAAEQLDAFERDMLACGDAPAVVAHLFDHLDELRAIAALVHNAPDARPKVGRRAQRAAARRPDTTRPVAPTPPPIASSAATFPLVQEHQSLQEPQTASPTQNWQATSPAQRSIHRVWADKWTLHTRLSAPDLEALLNRCMDRGTFATPLVSAAYHVSKHAPDMLVEDYIKAAQQQVHHWCGEVARRVFRQRPDAMAPTDDHCLVRVVRAPTGTGRFSWDGKLIWWEFFAKQGAESK